MDNKRFQVEYDASADVLYITVRTEAAARGTEDRHGIIWRYGRNNELIGATIMDLKERWTNNQHELASEISKHFAIPRRHADAVLEHVFDA